MAYYCKVKGCTNFVLDKDLVCGQHQKRHSDLSKSIGPQTIEAIIKSPSSSQYSVSTNQMNQFQVTTGPASSIDKTLEERGKRYGEFKDHAVIAQGIQDEMRKASGWNRLAPDQKQALSVIADKIARMLNGDPNYTDNWHDIIGYAKLVEDRLIKETTSGSTVEIKTEITNGPINKSI